ncbi:MAG: 4Fe-4S binding protein [Acidobacteriota bacterium]
MSASAEVLPETRKAKKAFIRRVRPDGSQRIRFAVQVLFVALNLWLGAQFYLWVRFYERGGTGPAVPRPTGVEGWLPIAGLMNLKVLLLTGHVPAIHPAAMFLLIAFLLISLAAKKAFCSWLCPVGAFSEQLGKLGRKIFGRRLRLPRWIDIPLRGLKYLLLGFFVYFIASMSAATLEEFMHTPYGLIADVKMLNFFRNMSATAAVVVLALVALSILIENVWCRYLCPYGALMGLVSLFSPLKIRRNPRACIDCSRCAQACPGGLAVDKLVQVRSVECTACLACVASCPAEGALQFSLPTGNTPAEAQPRFRRPVTGWAMAALLAGIFFGVVLFARSTNHWHTHVPGAVYRQLVPNANLATHPGLE